MKNTWWVDEGELRDEQKEVLALPVDGRWLVQGPPGSGKTNLLLLRAQYLALGGYPNVVIIVFTRGLTEFLNAGSKQYSFPPEQITTCQKWARSFLRAHGIRPDPKSDFRAERQSLMTSIGALIDKDALPPQYDAIMLDEAQDYTAGEITTFLKLSKRLFAVADSKQRIYEAGDGLDILRSSVDKTLILRYHYRNGQAICRLADGISNTDPMFPTCNYDEDARPSSVDHFAAPTLDAQIDRIIEMLKVQMAAYPDEVLGVMAPLREQVQHIWDRISRSNLASRAIRVQSGEEDIHFKDDTAICVTTLHSAKGMEFRAAHIAGLEALVKFDHRRNLAYMGATRAKTSLAFHYTGRLEPFLSSALAGLGRRVPPSLSKLFRKGS
jgi:superfamily I DNA/RNA helicase